MSKVIVYTRANGRVSVVLLPEEARDITIVDAAELPAGRENRDRWRLVGGRIVVPAEEG